MTGLGFRQFVRTALRLATLALALGPAGATVVPWMSLDELTGAAGVIVIGSVEATASRFSPDGRLIITAITVAVDTPLKGGPRARVELEVPGGRVGDQTLVASGAPVFVRGERVALFLSGEESRPLAVVGWNQGRMTVRRDPRTGRDLVQGQTAGALLVDRQGHPVGPGREGVGPIELGDFVKQVEALVAGQRGKAARP